MTRGDLWVTSKLWNDFHGKDQVEPHLRDSLAKLKLDYLDLYLVHWPFTGKTGPTLDPPMEETWEAMEEMVEKGLVKTIGVSNFSLRKLVRIMGHAKIPPAVNQVEIHPLWRQDNLLKSSKVLGIHLTAYSPLGSPDSSELLQHSGGDVLSHSTVQAVAAEVGRSAGQVLIRWAVQRGTSVVPKSTSESHIRDNFEGATSAEWSLSDDQMDRLSSIEPQQRMISGTFYVHPDGPYRTVGELWDEHPFMTYSLSAPPIEADDYSYEEDVDEDYGDYDDAESGVDQAGAASSRAGADGEL